MPVLFYCYTDKLLIILEANDIVCFIGEMLVGTLTYAVYIVFAVQKSRTLNRMLFTCDSFVDNLSTVFNAKRNFFYYLNLLVRLVVL